MCCFMGSAHKTWNFVTRFCLSRFVQYAVDMNYLSQVCEAYIYDLVLAGMFSHIEIDFRTLCGRFGTPSTYHMRHPLPRQPNQYSHTATHPHIHLHTRTLTHTACDCVGAVVVAYFAFARATTSAMRGEPELTHLSGVEGKVVAWVRRLCAWVHLTRRVQLALIKYLPTCIHATGFSSSSSQSRVFTRICNDVLIMMLFGCGCQIDERLT